MADKKLSSLTLPTAGMPGDDYGAETWLQNFAAGLANQPELWHFIDVTQEKAERIAALVKAFHDALMVATSPVSNSRPNIRAKTLARNEAVKAVREVFNAIKAAPEITSGQLWNFGIDPRKLVDSPPRKSKPSKAMAERATA